MIRKATPSDVSQLVELSIEALQIDAYEELVISRSKVQALVAETVSAAQHFMWVSEIGGKIVGALGALVYPMMFHERSSATVALWYCKEGGEGFALMRAFLDWVESRSMVKQLQYSGERNGDRRIIEILQKRYGFMADVPFLYRNR